MIERVRNVKAQRMVIGKFPSRNGMPLLVSEHNFTAGHQILAAIDPKPETINSFHQPDEAGLFANAIRMPFVDIFALRLAQSKQAHCGMKEPVTALIGKMIAQRVHGERSPEQTANSRTQPF